MSSSPCTVPRVFRCRVRDLASCFYACRFPLEEEHEIKCNKPPQMSKGDVSLDSKCGKMSNVKKKMCPKKEESSIQNSLEDGRGVEPRFADEDYIVFCFREDGEIHMINERKSYDDGDNINEDTNTTLRTINRKIHYGESVGYGWDSRRGIINPVEREIQDITFSNAKDDKKGNKQMETEWPPNDEIKEINPNLEQPSASKMDSFESCDSNLSDTSTSSFAFPVLGIEWIGSPVHMPKSEGNHPCSMRLHCCRF